MPVFGPGGTVVAALEIRVRDLRNDLPSIKAALTVAARSLSRELATGHQNGPIVPLPRAAAGPATYPGGPSIWIDPRTPAGGPPALCLKCSTSCSSPDVNAAYPMAGGATLG
jgi:hypothetical protein